MTSSTHHHPNHVSGCYRPAPIRAAFVPSPRNVHFRLQCGREIASAQPATDHLGDAIARMKGLTAASLQHTTIQIPIARCIFLTLGQHPAVSSLEACPTPAH